MNKFYSLLLFGLLFLISISLNASERNVKLDKEYKRYVPKEYQYKCKNIDDLCKKFYVGYYLFLKNHKNSLSLKYHLESYTGNIEKLLNTEPDAQDYYVTDTIARLYKRLDDSKNYIKYLKLSINAGNNQNICYLGRAYDSVNMIKEANELFKEGAKKHYPECCTDYGTYLFNGTYGHKDKELAGKYWKKAYWDHSYGITENYNMAVYYAYKNDNKKYKFHMLKASMMGDKEAKSYLKSAYLKNVSTTKLFLEEALGSKYKDVSKIKNIEFSSGFDLYYRMKTMFNKKDVRFTNWKEDYDYREKRWDKDKSNVVKFYKNQTSLIFEEKKLILQTTLDSHFKQKKMIQNLKLFYKVLLVDLSEAKEFNKFYTVTVGLLSKNESFEFKNKISQYNYKFYWYAKYNKKSGNLLVEISID